MSNAYCELDLSGCALVDVLRSKLTEFRAWCAAMNNFRFQQMDYQEGAVSLILFLVEMPTALVCNRILVESNVKKECTVGKVTALSRQERSVIVHRYRPVPDNHLRLYWRPVYVEDGSEVIGSGASPSTETVTADRILFTVQLHDGVLAHALG